ncbi:MAG: hypothetical protein AAF564_25520, partial [Bacteroidota bacterium]
FKHLYLLVSQQAGNYEGYFLSYERGFADRIGVKLIRDGHDYIYEQRVPRYCASFHWLSTYQIEPFPEFKAYWVLTDGRGNIVSNKQRTHIGLKR